MRIGRSHDTTVKGPGLARGPALIVGAILAGFGLVLFLESGVTATDGFPDGTAQGTTFLGFETNGWTAWFTTAAGVLLLFGAAQHLLAKTMSALVGIALAACVVISLIDGDDVLGLAAANFPVQLGWAIAAGILLLNVFAPRVDHDRDHHGHDHRDRDQLDRDHRDHRDNGHDHDVTDPTTSRRPVETERTSTR